MTTDPDGKEPDLTDGDEVLDDVDAEVVEDLDTDEESEDVFGGKGYVYSGACHTR